MMALSGLLAGLLLGGCVTPSLLPIADFTASPTTVISSRVVTFDASASQAPNGVITEYFWDFGDSITGSGMTVGHTYQTDVGRTFAVVLRITDHLGQQATATGEISVLAPVGEENQASVEFIWPFHYDAAGDDDSNLNDEYFALQNTGEETVDLSGWTVENDRGATYQIPQGIMLSPNAVLYIHSGEGSNTSSILYWQASEPVWSNNKDIAVLRNAEGNIVDVYGYGGC